MFVKQIFNSTWVNMVHKIATNYKDEPGDIEFVKSKSQYDNHRNMGTENYLQRWIPTKKEKSLHEHLNEVVFTANKLTYGYDIWLYTDVIQYTTYKSDVNAEFPLHTDSYLYGRPSTQKLTIVVGLTDKDSYEGGKLEINSSRNPVQYKLTAGQVIVFPSILNHRVTPVTRGTRQTLVTWYSGPMWR